MIHRVETKGSVFELDDDLMRYRRMPNREAPRERPEWSDGRAGPLEDFRWHPMVAWRKGLLRLVVQLEPAVDGRARVVSAPLPFAEVWENLWVEGLGEG